MVQSASVTALLTLDASNFNTGIENSINSVKKFVSTLTSANTTYENFRKTVMKLQGTMQYLNDAFNRFNVESSKAESFNKIANGLKSIINSARQLAEGNISLKGTYQQLQNVVNMFGQMLSQQEIKLRGNIALTRELAQVNSQASGRVKVAGFGKDFYDANASQIQKMISESERLRANLHNLNGAYSGVASSFNATNSAFSSSANTIGRLNTEVTKSSTSMRNLSTSVNSTATAVSHMVNSTNSQSSAMNKLVTMANGLTTSLEKASTSAKLFGSEFQLAMSQSASSMQYLTNATQSFGLRINPSLNQTATNMKNVTMAGQGIPVTMNGVATSTNKAGESTMKYGRNVTSATSSTRSMESASRGLTGTLNGLRMVVGMVASMFLFNFAHNMLISVKNTVTAKSEMLSYLQTMGMTQNQINSFNMALDQTAERFQRINKYNIGETVANIGLEFDLSAKEMEKAMSVTSMITSEYLRAGRNADEAALAVKDIMQGQFQRLSRETGVKGETLKAFGWSGDETDVLGLMDALEKAAKSRHWDTFAEKANSLNDVVLITQNRLSEWATDMTEGFTPLVTQGFNLLVAGITGVTTVLGQLGESLHLPDWTGTALMVTGLVVALGGLVTSTITARTGLGLLGIAHQGLGQSIIATIFNIDKEALANQKATTIAMGKVLGLNAEAVAERGLAGAIAQSIMQQELENLQTEQSIAMNVGKTTSLEAVYLAYEQGITVKEATQLLETQEQLSNMRSITLLTAKALGLNMTTLAQEGFIVALGKRIAMSSIYQAFLSEETAKNIGLAGAIALTMSALLPLLAIFGALAVATGSWLIEVNNACEKMSEFNTLIKDGDNMIKDAKETTDSYRKSISKLEEEMASGTLTAEQYRQKEIELKEVKEQLRFAEDAERDTIEAVERARSSRAKSEEARTKTAIKSHGDMIEIVQRLGYEYDRAADAANKYGSALEYGLRIEQELANHEEWNRGRTFDYLEGYSKNAQNKGYNEEDIIRRSGEYYDVIAAQNKQYNKMLASESLGEYVEGFLGWKWNQAVEEMMKIQDYWNTGDFFKAYQKFSRGLAQIQPMTYIVDSLFGDSLEQLKPILEGWFSEDWDELSNLGKRISDGFSNFDKWITDGLNNLNNIDIGKMISDWWNSFDFSFFTNEGGSIFDKIFVDDGGEKMNSYIQSTIIQPLTNLPTTIQTYLNNSVINFVSFASQLLTQGISAGSNFLNGVVSYISQLPSRFLTYITQTASTILSGASQWVANARNKASETVNAVISVVSQLPQKVFDEFNKIAQRIRDAIGGAVEAARSFGNAVKDAVLGALRIFSPGIVQEKIATEFADIPSRISENNAQAEAEASSFGNAIVTGMSNQMSNIQATAQMMSQSMGQMQPITDGSFVGEYQSDASAIYGINASMTSDTMMAFGTMGDTVNTTINGVSANLITSYSNMNASQTTALTTMQNQNKTAYTNLQNQTTTSLNNMRSTTQNVTLQMVNAWDHMKNNIISSADQLKTQSTAHFNQLSSNIGGFYQKLQNPSMWGGGDKVPSRHYSPSRGLRGARAVQRAFGVPTRGGRVAGGPSPDNLPQTMTLRKLKSMMGGNSSIFDGLDLNKEVNVIEFLSQFDGAFGWGDWHPNHFDRIKTTSGEWDMRGPQIMHRIDTGTAFKVKEFYNSTPSISFGSFQKMAEALFSAIPYDFYYNSDKYGSWVNALQAGACNCYDGANALIALAGTCGFSGTLGSGTWNGIPHVYAIINGKKMDTTGWQQRRDWNGVSAGSPSNMKGFGGNKTVNINIDMTGATFNGEDDFENMMRDVAQRVIGEEVNTSITIGI